MRLRLTRFATTAVLALVVLGGCGTDNPEKIDTSAESTTSSVGLETSTTVTEDREAFCAAYVKFQTNNGQTTYAYAPTDDEQDNSTEEELLERLAENTATRKAESAANFKVLIDNAPSPDIQTMFAKFKSVIDKSLIHEELIMRLTIEGNTEELDQALDNDDVFMEYWELLDSLDDNAEIVGAVCPEIADPATVETKGDGGTVRVR